MQNENLLEIMIRNISRFGEKDAKDIMTHRKNIVALDAEKTLQEAVTFVMNQNYSRVPVYQEDIDNLIGTLHLRDLMQCYLEESDKQETVGALQEYIRPVSYIPETKSLESLFREMQSNKTHMVVVLDEYGMTSGLVTMEDILEEIVGDIFDEYDTVEESIHQNPDGTYVVSGLTELEDLEDLLEMKFEGNEDFDTLNGFLIACLDHIPSEQEKCVVEYMDYQFHVLKVKNNMIQTVKIEKAVKE
ncbi:MAG: HlyC/CorC family transporter [Hespellia sp.]|nr:HlyC/CorC family transporter [Hespellia sp.]